MLINNKLSSIFLLVFLLLLSGTSSALPIGQNHVEVSLISEQEDALPGDTISIGVLFKLEPEWHLYWTNPGDAGLAPRINWNIPNGFVALPPEFPVPKRIPAGPLVSFGYDGKLLLSSRIVVPEQIDDIKSVTIGANIDWLVCKVECIPGEARLSMTLPLTTQMNPSQSQEATEFDLAREQLPAEDPVWSVSAQTSTKQLKLLVSRNDSAPAAPPTDLFFFPEQKGIIDNAAVQQLKSIAGGFELTIPRNPMNTDSLSRISGLLVSRDKWISNNISRGLSFAAPVVPINQPDPIVVASSDISWWQAILLAFAGGIILNLMPCVLPVLSIKVLGFVQQANESKRKIRLHNLLFTLGVLVSFWLLASALLLLRAGGEQLGWGFQLQSPPFIMVLASFMFLVGLNLLGVFEIGSSLTGIGSGTRRSGMIGSFVTGVTATVVATPCTAPFMGSALGYSLTQPAPTSLAIFTALGFGMAMPYVLLTSSPFLLRFVPKPGRWMETLKHAMGFLMMATVVWLAWVMSVQTGANSVLFLLSTLLCLGVAAWILGRWGALSIDRGKRLGAQFISAIVIVMAVTTAAMNLPSAATVADNGASSGGLAWEPFSPERVAELRGQGRPLLIDFTAAWCLSCKVNEQVAFSSGDVQDRLNELQVVTMKADWTSRDSRITQALAEFGRNSVPLYVLYTGRSQQLPIILPEILTPGIVLEALNKLEG